MARYLIDTDDGRDFAPGDPEVSFDCPHKAKAAADKVLGAMTDHAMPGSDRRVFRAVVRDESGQEVYEAIVMFSGRWKIPQTA